MALLPNQLLARFSFTSQQLLLPQPWTAAMTGSEGTEKIDITGMVTRGDSFCQYSWTDYYNNSRQQNQYHRSTCPRAGWVCGSSYGCHDSCDSVTMSLRCGCSRLSALSFGRIRKTKAMSASPCSRQSTPGIEYRGNLLS